jgi:23S rRNA (adenine2030-N6)-methyltransferase
MNPPSSYDHRYHAGNHGDVWKHTAWLSVLAAHKRERVWVLDTHGGRGEYALPPRGGEWTAGVGRLLERYPRGTSTGAGAVDRYLARIEPQGPYPGSPALSLRALGRSDALVSYESDPDTAAALRRAVGGDSRARVIGGDGWQAPELEQRQAVRALVLIDPPYVEKADWERVVSAAERAWRAGHEVVAWYPIKRWTRPHQLQAALRERGVPHVSLDLLVTPLELANDRMAGSGLVLISPPPTVVVELHAAAPVVGAALAPAEGRWAFKSSGFAP